MSARRPELPADVSAALAAATAPKRVGPPAGPLGLAMRMSLAVTAVVDAWNLCHAEEHTDRTGFDREPVIYTGASGLVDALDRLALVDRECRDYMGDHAPGAPLQTVELPVEP